MWSSTYLHLLSLILVYFCLSSAAQPLPCNPIYGAKCLLVADSDLVSRSKCNPGDTDCEYSDYYANDYSSLDYDRPNGKPSRDLDYDFHDDEPPATSSRSFRVIQQRLRNAEKRRKLRKNNKSRTMTEDPDFEPITEMISRGNRATEEILRSYINNKLRNRMFDDEIADKSSRGYKREQLKARREYIKSQLMRLRKLRKSRLFDPDQEFEDLVPLPY